MRHDSSSDVAADEAEDERSVTAVADEPAVTRERAPEIRPGDLLAGRYQIEAIIGKGGSGIVLRAFDRVSATVVAVKVLKTGLTHDPRWEKRFQRELRLGRPIQHPNVCRIFDIGDSDGYRFLTMEYAKSGTLRDLIKKNQPLRSLAERLADAGWAIAGLAAIHEAGIVHRDVKPDNMLRMEDGRLVLSDFGLATDLPDSTMVSVFVGTPHYMAPEVREGDPATTRSDVWSLGVVLHEIFFGKRPERRASRTASGIARSSTVASSSTIERAMMALCLRCLSDDPAERPEDARAVQGLFENAQRSPYALLRSPRRRLASAGGAGILAAAVVAALGVRSYRSAHAPPEPAGSSIPKVAPTGEPADWSKFGKAVATLEGHVHCFSMVNGTTARLIWGTPRRAEDIDVATGARTLSRLAPTTFMVGCPDVSPQGNRILFTARNSVGGTEIRLTNESAATDSKTITPGSDPAWLPNGEEFVFTLDASHAAVFSLPTMKFSLLPAAGLAGQQTVLGKTVSPTGNSVAVMLFSSESSSRAVAIYDGPALDHQKTFLIPAAFEIQFVGTGKELLISHQVSATQSTLASLDWKSGTARNLGRLPGFDLVGAREEASQMFVLGRRRSQEIWYYDEQGGRRRLPAEGEVFSAAISPNADLLLSKRTPEGDVSIWWQGKDGSLRPVTRGSKDVEPQFSPDGSLWAYADYAQKSIMLCTTSDSKCRVLVRDELLPTWPRFSPDGKRLAYLTQVNVPRLSVLSLQDGAIRQLGDTHYQCPPVWASPDSLWNVEGESGQFFWSEREVESGTKTGRRLNLDTNMEDPQLVECWPSSAKPGSPFFRSLRVEAKEEFELLRLTSK
jgi:serine/threonine-protein kinase